MKSTLRFGCGYEWLSRLEITERRSKCVGGLIVASSGQTEYLDCSSVRCRYSIRREGRAYQ